MTNPIFTLVNQLFTDILSGVTTLLSGSTGQVVVGFVAIGLMVGLVLLVKGIINKSKANG